MIIEWRPLIEIFHNNERIGHVELSPRRTEALPRVGEFVGFSEDPICEALELKSSITYVPVVTAVHHLIDPEGAEVSVHIKMKTYRDEAGTTRLAEENGIHWLPDSPA